MRTIQSPTFQERTSSLSLGRTFKDSVLAIDRLLAVWQARHELREELRRMPDYLLRDVGLTEEQVREEAGKPFWRA